MSTDATDPSAAFELHLEHQTILIYEDGRATILHSDGRASHGGLVINRIPALIAKAIKATDR